MQYNPNLYGKLCIQDPRMHTRFDKKTCNSICPNVHLCVESLNVATLVGMTPQERFDLLGQKV